MVECGTVNKPLITGHDLHLTAIVRFQSFGEVLHQLLLCRCRMKVLHKAVSTDKEACRLGFPEFTQTVIGKSGLPGIDAVAAEVEMACHQTLKDRHLQVGYLSGSPFGKITVIIQQRNAEKLK